MSVNITSSKQLVDIINKRIQTAVEITSSLVVKQLKLFIEEDFYNAYSPKFYERTYQFLRSVDVTLLKNSSIVYIDTGRLLYQDASGEHVVELASEGYHGNKSIHTEGSFWDNFMKWCADNILIIFKQELEKQGLKIK